ncbi:hypothetical protein LPB72_05845 [Hydrogenophaga crassostreae]|uniref:Putative DNA-binding domain-containing protein n=1 Tax=Hydrogenophaga crassostreae TaxID=1763535 RepID=A0A162W2S6_9BURK|nr:DNA-binding domain-containing protein [Hydrogenophaga crassostreae]AOW14559.1 hypothetical protein LPB072_18705 [Hydrogenophaga crassostreae]OAD43344.1 hypothetical protein LPB72_05845 [Hydrogenophaga crassostreae]
MTQGNATTALQTQQEALVKALFARPGEASVHAELLPLLDQCSLQSQRGLQAYQANGHALAERSLRAAFPVIEHMVGSNSFNALARDLWHQHPPERGDLAQWGAALPAFVASNPQLADAPYLSDVAQVEWALHRAAFEADTPPDPASFVRLTEEDPETLALTLAPGVHTVTSRFPVASLVLAHLQDHPNLAEATDRLRRGDAETALIWRQDMKPRLMLCTDVAAALIALLQSGRDIADALDGAMSAARDGTDEHFDFSAWLTEAVTQGVVIGVHTAQSRAV